MKCPFMKTTKVEEFSTDGMNHTKQRITESFVECIETDCQAWREDYDIKCRMMR